MRLKRLVPLKKLKLILNGKEFEFGAGIDIVNFDIGFNWKNPENTTLTFELCGAVADKISNGLLT